MHQFWSTIKKIENLDAYNFKLEKKKFRVDTEVFREILQICPIILNQDFVAPPSEEELVTFIQELGYSDRCNMESQAQILWGMYNKKNVDYVALLWEDFMYQADNREISSARKEHMPYPRFTKVIINHFISKDKAISMRNMINLHTIHDDSLLDIKDSQAYKTYYDFATRKVPLRKARKYNKVASPSRKLSLSKKRNLSRRPKELRDLPRSLLLRQQQVLPSEILLVYLYQKKKAHAKADRSKGIEILYDVALSKAAQLKEATKRSKKDYHISQEISSGDGTNFESGVPDEQQRNTSGTDEGTDDNDDDSKCNDDKADSDDDGNSDADDNERTDSDDDDGNPSFTLKDYDKKEHEEEYESDDDYENMFEEEDDDLYKDVNVRSLGAEHERETKGNEEMTNADQNKTESSKQSSSVSSDFASKFLILENVPPAVDEVASMMKSRQEESSTQAPSLFTVPETAIVTTVI
ncbi:hypothetical protein Tco_1428963 [Tanacetum coccineum]